MSFTPALDTVLPLGVEGNLRIARGTFVNTAGSTGGAIPTSLQQVMTFKMQHTGAAVVANCPVVNGTFPINGGSVTIVTDANTSGIWEAKGR